VRRGPAVIAQAQDGDRPPAKPAGGRFRSPLWWGAAIAAVTAILLLAYLRIAGTTPVVSDGAANAMQAWDIMHGDPLLHGWYVTDVSFYTTELPQYMLVEAIAGLRPEVVHICAAITYTLLILLAAAVARGQARGAEGAARALLAAGVMLAPQPGDATGFLLTEPDHVGAAVPVLLLMLLLDWARPRWYVPAAVFAVLTLAIVGEPLTLLIGVLPFAAVCLARAASALPRRRVPWFELSLAGAAVLAVPASTVANRLITALHGYSTNKNPATLQHLAVLSANVPMTARGFLALFGADVWGARGALNQAFAAVHLAGAALVVAAIALAAWRLARTLGSRAEGDEGDLVADLLVVAIVANVAAYFLMFRVRQIYAAHEIAPVLSLGAALAGRLLGGPLLRARPLGARLAPALAAVLACYAVMLGFAAARPPVPPANAAVTGWLTSHGLRSGIAPYWDATSVTLDSGGTIAMGSVVPARGGLAPWHWEEDMRFFARSHRADFLLTSPQWSVTPALAAKVFGPPAHTYHFQAYTIMVWRKNLLPRLGRPVP
jgi:hypothetical protein